MATVQRFEGPSLDDVLAQVRLALGDDAEIIEANRIKASGVIGSDRYEVKARRAQRGQRRADRQAADAHVNPMSGAGAGRGEAYPGGLDDATVQAAMDHVQQVMADLERKRIAQDHADTPSPTSLVDLADQVVDDSPAPAFGAPNLGDDPSFAALLAEARANAKANAPKIAMEWPELDAMSSADMLADAQADDGTVEWEPLDWSARRVRAAEPEPMSPPTADAPEEVEAYGEDDDDFGPALVGEGFGSRDDSPVDEPFTREEPETVDAELADDGASGEDTDRAQRGFADADLLDDGDSTEDLTPSQPAAVDSGSPDAPPSAASAALGAGLWDETVAGPDQDEASSHLEVAAQDAELASLDEPVDEPAQTKDLATPEPEPTGEAHDRALPSPDDAAGAIALAEPAGAPRTQPELGSEPVGHHDDAVTSALPRDEVDESAQTGWVDADREFMGVWTDEAEHDDAGWFATGEPDDEVQAFATLRNHRLVEWLSRNDLTPEALHQALEGLPRTDDLPPGPGVIIAVVGEGPLVLPLARRIAVDLEADPAKVVLASELRSHASVPDNCRISSADEAALDRRAWRRRGTATLVAVDTSTSLAANAQDWACQVLESLQPHQVIALVDAGRKAEDVARWIADLGGVDAIALTGLEETVSPHAILELGIPVARLGTQVATPKAWTALLRNRREPVE